jgi:hypothetical protein
MYQRIPAHRHRKNNTATPTMTGRMFVRLTGVEGGMEAEEDGGLAGTLPT